MHRIERTMLDRARSSIVDVDARCSMPMLDVDVDADARCSMPMRSIPGWPSSMAVLEG
jgi:hypothetical protein